MTEATEEIRIPRPKGYTDWWQEKALSKEQEQIVPPQERSILLNWVRNDFIHEGVYLDAEQMKRRLKIASSEVFRRHLMETINDVSIIGGMEPAEIIRTVFNTAFTQFTQDRADVISLAKEVKDQVMKEGRRGKYVDNYAATSYNNLMTTATNITKEMAGLLRLIANNKNLTIIFNNHQEDEVDSNEEKPLTVMEALKLLRSSDNKLDPEMEIKL